MTWVGVAVGGAALIGSGISAIGAKSAADQQRQGAQNALNLSENQFQQIKGLEQPFVQGGYSALSALDYGLGVGPRQNDSQGTGLGYGSLTQPFTAAYMKQYSPAYQFQLQQGRQGVLNQDAGTQGALSGAALKDLIGFNQGYANTAFNSAFNQYQTQQQNTYNRLANIANLGQSAASQQAQSGTALAGQAAQSATNIGTAGAAGTIGIANSLSGGIGNAALLGGLYGGQAGGFGFTPQDASQYNSAGFNSSPLTSAGGGYLVNTPGYTGP